MMNSLHQIHFPFSRYKVQREFRLVGRMRQTLAIGAVIACLVVGGCTGGGTPAPTLSLSGTQALDAGQSITITSNEDVTWALSGPGSLANQSARSVTYNAPAVGTFIARRATAKSSAVSFASSADPTATVTATSKTNTSKTTSVTINLSNPPSITTTSLPNGIVGTAYNQTIGVTGGAGTLTFTVSTGILPAGLTLSTAGAITGTPTTVGTSSFTVKVTDSSVGGGLSATQNLSIIVQQAPAITSANSVTFVVGTAGTFTVTTTGTPTPTLTETGTLPSGVTFKDNGNGTGTLSGTPAAGSAANYSITFSASNGVGTAATQNFTLTVGQPPAITSASSTTFTASSAGTFNVNTTGFPAPSLTETGALPSGVTFKDNGNGTATLSGTPAGGTGGTYSITVKAHNGIGTDASQSFTLTVNETPSITSANKTTFTVSTAGTFTVTTSGFPTPSITETGTLPTGVTFVDNHNGTGTLAGIPAAGTAGNYPITFTPSNSVGSPASQSFTLTVGQPPAITSGTTTTFTVGTAGTFSVTTTGFPAPSLSESGGLPSGVSFKDNGNGTATLSGTPATGTGKTYSIMFTATNGVGSSATQNFTLTVNESPTITSASSTTFTVNAAGTFNVTTSGFPSPSLTESGALPSGVTFKDNGNGTGTLAGTPTQSGTFPITFTATNSVGSSPQTFTLTVNTAPVITSASSTTFTVGVAGTFSVTTTGTPTPTLAETGALPSGVTFTDNGNGTGTLAGTPAAGTGKTYPITFKATNSAGSNSQSFTLTVDQAPAITSPSSTTFTEGASGSFTVMTTGFPAPALSDVSTPPLPSGVTFTDNGNGTGTLSGTPASGTAGTYSITFTANNGVGTPATQSFTLTVNSAPVFTSGTSTTFTVGTAGSFTVTATGTPSPTVSETGTLPTGVSFTGGTGTGTLSGTPAAGSGGTYPITFKATSSSGTTQQTFTLTVDQAPAITSASSTTFTVGINGSFTVTTTGFPLDPITETGALPSGVTFVDNGNNTATLSGTPAAGTAASYPIIITASNGVAPNATQNFTLTVSAARAIVSTSVGNFGVPFFAGNPGTTITITVANDAPGDVVTAGLTVDANTSFNCTMVTCGTLGAVTGTSGSGTYIVSYTPPPSSPNFIQTFPTLVVNSSLPGAIGSTDFIEVDPAGILVAVGGVNLGGTVFVGATPAETRNLFVTIYNDNTQKGLTFAPLTGHGYACATLNPNSCGTLGAATAPTYTTDTSTGTSVSVGSLTIPYTAPAALPAAPYDTPLVQAISVADNTRSGSVAFLLANDPAAPNLPSMFIVRNFKFKTALIGTPTSIIARILNDSGPSKTVNWTLTAGGANCSPTCGTLGSPTAGVNGTTVTSTITYTPPVSVPVGASATPTITATSADNPPGGTDSFSFNILDPTCGSGNEKVLNGQYAFLLKGGGAGGGYTALIGSFTADGAGHITGGLLDVNSSGAGAFLGATLLTAAQGQLPASSYSVGADNRGCLTLTDSTGGFAEFRFGVGTMVTVNGVSVASQGRMIRFDDATWRNRAQSGVIYRQDPTSFATNKFNGSYAFGEEGVDSSGGRFAGAGVVTSDGAGNITNLIGDFDDAGGVTGAVTGGSGTYAPPNTNGRSTATTTLTIAGKASTSHLVVYLVSPSQALMMTTDLLSTGSTIFSGELKKQTGPFTATTLDNGDFAVYTKGLGSGGGNATLIGQLTFTTNGNATFTRDVNDNGTLATEKVGPVIAAIEASGRATFTGTGAGNHPAIVYLIDSSTAFIVGTSGASESGFGEKQVGGTFSTASINGQFFFGGDAPVPVTLYESGTATFDGAGNINGTGDHSGTIGLGVDTISPASNGGTYSFSSTSVPLGKGTVGPSAIAYVISGSKLIFMNTGNNVAIFVVQK